MFLPYQIGITVQGNARDIEQQRNSGKIRNARHDGYNGYDKRCLSAPCSELCTFALRFCVLALHLLTCYTVQSV